LATRAGPGQYPHVQRARLDPIAKPLGLKSKRNSHNSHNSHKINVDGIFRIFNYLILLLYLEFITVTTITTVSNQESFDVWMFLILVV
jgi:hypothetical protein